MRAIVKTISDQRREFLKDPSTVKSLEIDATEPIEVSAEEIDLSDLLEISKETLKRDILNLNTESRKGKLKQTSSTALNNYIKLLTELLKEEKSRLTKLSREELETLVNETDK